MIELIVQRDCKPCHIERMAVIKAAMLSDNFRTHSCNSGSIADLVRSYEDAGLLIHPSNYMPVGSVEFLLESFAAFGIPKPPNLDYPECSNADLIRLLGRHVTQQKITAETKCPLFIKPVETKAFPAKVYQDIPLELIGQIAWVSKPIKITGEWRVYVNDSVIVGRAQYDAGLTMPLPKNAVFIIAEVMELINHQENAPKAYAIDIGLVDQRSVLIELNDGWATGYYPQAMTESAYLQWLHARWQQLSLTKPTDVQG